MSYKSGSVFGKTPPSTTPVPTKPAAVDDSSDLVGGELKGGEEGVDIFPSSDPILGSSSTDIITVDIKEETPKQKIIRRRRRGGRVFWEDRLFPKRRRRS